ncbi:putative metal-dependent hydrolase [Chryseobacterium formosus]|uniref:Metal-dependent hydrolase n=1 Tax=Chryseobacterium formosus TaxID=1537363 RepID=A0ABT3XP59_9FLAO|nr:putative metal-dependent hydrolase [Chryseobacterium formosus]MCX8523277.1 putative metal-dependent hydrolase [Chryseobacterium formosus]
MEENIEQLKFPIGKFEKPKIITENHIKNWIETIKNFPQKLKSEVENLSKDDLKKTYRPNGWMISQVVNHCADSHMNSLVRFKLALTEETPTIKPYQENSWAELVDSKDFSIESSIKMLEGIHERWTFILENLSEIELNRTFIHPEGQEEISLKTNIGIYAWHCNHHLNHVIIAKRN